MKVANNIIKRPNKPWFAAKQYGLGWGLPLTWQGWLVLAIYLIIMIESAINVSSYKNPNPEEIILFVTKTIVASSILVIVAYFTGEKLKWRWGGK